MPPTSTNYTSVVQCSGKVIQTQPSHHMPQPTPLVQMGPAQLMPLQHISQSHPQQQQTKSSTSHQISIQSTQAAPFVSNVPLQVRTTASKYETAPSQKFKQHIMPPNMTQIQSQSVSIAQQQQSVAKQSTFPPQSMPPSNQMRLHQASQIMTGAVASPPPKQPHLNSQQPIVAGKLLTPESDMNKHMNEFQMKRFVVDTGANSSRVNVPPLSPQGQQNRPHNLQQQPGLPVPGYEGNLVSNTSNSIPTKNQLNLTHSSKLIEIRTQHSDIGGFSLLRNQSPPPAHQQASQLHQLTW